MTGHDTVRLTYAELARCRGVSIGAAKRLAQRHRWARQIGNDGLSRISVPATFVKGREFVADDVAEDITADVTCHVAADAAIVVDDVARHAAGNTEDTQAISLDEALRAFATVVRDVTADTFREVADDVVRDVTGDVVATLRAQLQTEYERAERAEMQMVTERDRADRAEQRAGEAETRLRELHERLESEMTEHRRIVGLLAEQLSARRSWWPWRRR